MPQVLVRDVDAATLGRLKSRARERGRSLQAELKDILAQAAAASPAATRARVRRVRAMFSGRTFSDSTALIRQDRAR